MARWTPRARDGGGRDTTCRVMNVVTCFGITVSYLIFIAETLKVVAPTFGYVGTPTTRRC